MKKTMIALSMAALFGATSANAMDFDPANFYYGGGITQTDVDFSGLDTMTGFQLFAGMPLDIDMGEVKSSLEVGFRDIGDADYSVNTFFGTFTTTVDGGSGLYADYIAAYPMGDQFDLMGIIGLDFNSDMDMIEYGIGGHFQVNDNLGARLTYMFKESDEGGLDVNILGIAVTYKQ